MCSPASSGKSFGSWRLTDLITRCGAAFPASNSARYLVLHQVRGVSREKHSVVLEELPIKASGPNGRRPMSSPEGASRVRRVGLHSAGLRGSESAEVVVRGRFG